jgi:hypothetical protein
MLVAISHTQAVPAHLVNFLTDIFKITIRKRVISVLCRGAHQHLDQCHAQKHLRSVHAPCVSRAGWSVSNLPSCGAACSVLAVVGEVPPNKSWHIGGMKIKLCPWPKTVAGIVPQRPGSVHGGFVVDRLALGLDFLPVFQFFPVSIIPPWFSMLIYHLADEQ